LKLVVSGKFRRLLAFRASAYSVGMKKKNNASKLTVRGAWENRKLNKLVVKPLLREIRRQRDVCFKQGRRIFKKVKAVEESIDMIAREMHRQAEKRKEEFDAR
jgi:hypothetical protein